MRTRLLLMQHVPLHATQGTLRKHKQWLHDPEMLQGKVVRIVQRAAAWLGMGRQWRAVAEAPTLEAQRAAWNRQACARGSTAVMHRAGLTGPNGSGLADQLQFEAGRSHSRRGHCSRNAHCALSSVPPRSRPQHDCCPCLPHRSLWLVRLLHAAPSWLLSVIADVAALLCFNRITLWCAGGAGRCWAAPGVCRRRAA